MNKNYEGITKNLFYIYLIAGAVLGTICANCIMLNKLLCLDGLFVDTYYKDYAMSGMESELFLRILPIRIILGGIVGLFLILYSKEIGYALIVISCTFLWGMLASIEIIRGGGQGMLLLCAGIIPHSFFYLLSIQYLWYGKQMEGRMKLYIPILIYCIGILVELFLEPQLFRYIYYMICNYN